MDRNERTIYVSNFDERVDHLMVKEMFTQVGPLEDVSIKSTPGKTPFAFVEFSDVESVLFACKVMDAVELFGRKIRVMPRDRTKQREKYEKEGMFRRSQELHRGFQSQRRSDYQQGSSQLQQQRQPVQPHFVPPPPPPVPISIPVIGTYGDRPRVISETNHLVLQKQQIVAQQMLMPTFQHSQGTIATFNNSAGPRPWINTPAGPSNAMPGNNVHGKDYRLLPPPPPPPVFYQAQVDQVKDKIQKDGGRYRPYNPNSSFRNQHHNSGTSQQRQGHRYQEHQNKRNFSHRGRGSL